MPAKKFEEKIAAIDVKIDRRNDLIQSHEAKIEELRKEILDLENKKQALIDNRNKPSKAKQMRMLVESYIAEGHTIEEAREKLMGKTAK